MTYNYVERYIQLCYEPDSGPEYNMRAVVVKQLLIERKSLLKAADVCRRRHGPGLRPLIVDDCRRLRKAVMCYLRRADK